MQGSSKADWLLYVLKCRDGTLYTGVTNNLKKRLAAHNSGKGAKYTRGRGPCEILAYCFFPDKSSCLKAEIRFKKLSRMQKLNAIESGLSKHFSLPENLNADHDQRNSD